MLCPLDCDEAKINRPPHVGACFLLQRAESRVFRLPGHPCPASPPSASCSAFCPLTHSAFPESSLLVPVLLLSGRAPPHSTLSHCLVTLSVSSRRPSWPRSGAVPLLCSHCPRLLPVSAHVTAHGIRLPSLSLPQALAVSGAAQFPHSRCSVNTHSGIPVRSCSVSWLGKVFKSLPGHGRKEEREGSTEVEAILAGPLFSTPANDRRH